MHAVVGDVEHLRFPGTHLVRGIDVLHRIARRGDRPGRQRPERRALAFVSCRMGITEHRRLDGVQPVVGNRGRRARKRQSQDQDMRSAASTLRRYPLGVR